MFLYTQVSTVPIEKILIILNQGRKTMFYFCMSLLNQDKSVVTHQTTGGRDRRTPEMPIFADTCNCTVKMMVW